MLVPNDVFQCKISYSLPESSVMENVFHFQVNGPAGSQAAEADAVVAMQAAFNTAYGELTGFLHMNLSLLSMAVDRLQFNAGTGHWEILYHMGDVILLPVGSAVGDELPPANCALIKWRTLYQNRQGRKYFGGFGESACNADGDIEPVLVMALADFATDLLAQEFDIGGTPNPLYALYVILHADAELMNEPLAAVISANFAVQRRRKQNVGS